MHKIAIDTRMGAHPGIGRYIRELVVSLLDQRPADIRWVFLGDPSLSRQFAAKAGDCDFIHAKSPIYSVDEQWEMSYLAHGVDLLHVPHFNISVLSRTPLVTTIHDLTYVHQKGSTRSILGRSYAKSLMRIAIQRSKTILTVSEYTKKDILQCFPKTDPSKIIVTYEAASSYFKKIEGQTRLNDLKNKLMLEKPFVLSVGSLKTHKNIPTLLSAMKLLHESGKIDAELLIVGRKDSKDDSLLRQIQAAGNGVRYLGELEDESLLSLYNLCEVFVLPSLREGFGLPVLEAMSCGAPVIVSDRTSLPEIAGDAGLVFDAMSAEALAHQMQKVFTDTGLRKRLSTAGLARAREFSWKKTAEKTLEVYRKALQ